ncbi:hypothetical protein D9M69_596260 [compost metagenome]
MPHIKSDMQMASGTFLMLMAYRYTNDSRPEARAPTMIGGLRPMRSDRLPTNGITSTARMLPSTGIHRYTSFWKPMP